MTHTTNAAAVPDEESYLLGASGTANAGMPTFQSPRSVIQISGPSSDDSHNGSHNYEYRSDPSFAIARLRRLADFLGGLVVAAAAFMLLQPAKIGHVATTNTAQSAQPNPLLKEPQAMAFDFSTYPHLLQSAHHHDHAQHAHDHNTIPSKYTKFQALGFQIYTGGAPAVLYKDDDFNAGKKPYHNPECRGLNSYGKADDFDDDDLENANLTLTKVDLWECYLGRTNPKEDVRQRLQIMTDAVAKAEKVADKDESTLKIFIAPEFFWRGKDGAYFFYNESAPTKSQAEHDEYFTQEELDDDCAEVCLILKGLEALVAQPQYKDWLFLFGTVIVSEVLPKEDTYDYLFYNFAPVYRGYDPEETDHYGKRFLVPKRYVSNIDFLTPVREVHDNSTREILPLLKTSSGKLQKDSAIVQVTEDEGPNHEESTVVHNPFEMKRDFYDRDMWYAYKDELNGLGYTMLEYDWLILDNITFTIEVCLDHEIHTALKAYMADTVLGSPTLIPKNVETYDHKLKRNTGWIEYVNIPRHQAQLSLVSSAGMSVNPASMALANNGTIILQDGLSSKEGTMVFSSECEHYSWHFSGGSEHISRSAKLSSTEIVFEYSIHSGHQQVGIWDDLEDLSDTTWKGEIQGVFTTERYEPKITVYSPKDIAQV
ncbi:expressed unknown protein [Seminavis robusta]|uniref:Uncharacterized protein n=1 Tax=Seminavis robusta TaxID=568900 RepID=A0A9N8DCK2_9STRA|nr:expressed unknown protein [Seminavis robusta]|eukprot:Sro16_g011750.1 n/a (653) ;mRNA; r:92487-94445